MIRTLTLALLVAGPLLALAAAPKPKPSQAAPAADSAAPAAEQAAGEGELDLAPAPLEGGARAGGPGGATVPPPDTYTIRPGDTLWDLSGRFLNNPWYWPKIWSYNPEITNPHWISPGNLLRFYPSGEEAPTEVAPAEVAKAEEEVPEEEAEPVRELEDLSRANMSAAASGEEQEAVTVAGPHKIGEIAPRSPFTRRDAFITPKELEDSGTIRAAFEEKSLLSFDDRAYATFRSRDAVKVGETYSVYRAVQPVKHPVTHELIGYQSTVLGAAKVVALDDRAATLKIISSFDTIERGDLLGPWTEKPYRAVPVKANAKELKGYVVSAPIEYLTNYAEYNVVFVDLGKAEGVEEGNRFTLVRAGDPLNSATDVPKWDPSLPVEDVGSLLAVDVREHATAALVTRAIHEIGPGEKVEMRQEAK